MFPFFTITFPVRTWINSLVSIIIIISVVVRGETNLKAFKTRCDLVFEGIQQELIVFCVSLNSTSLSSNQPLMLLLLPCSTCWIIILTVYQPFSYSIFVQNILIYIYAIFDNIIIQRKSWPNFIPIRIYTHTNTHIRIYKSYTRAYVRVCNRYLVFIYFGERERV